jgi:uncharacterized protein YciI
MFVVILRFSNAKTKAGQHMEGHKEWINRGFDEGIFVMTGSVHPNQGGMVFAANTSRPDLEKRVSSDPFVVEGVVSAEIFEVTPSRADPRLAFLT